MADQIPPNQPPTPPSNSDVGEDVFTNWVRWKCLVCGYVYEGQKTEQAVECPRCHNKDPDKFADVD